MKHTRLGRFSLIIAMLFIAGCAGMRRGCSSWYASSFGSDWIIVQYRFDGTPINCWKLEDTSVDNEGQSDGIYWKDGHSGHLVHIAGWYNRVQIANRDFKNAAELLGVDLAKCGNGRYLHQQ